MVYKRPALFNPVTAAHVAKDLGIKIHTIGIGTRTPQDDNSNLVGILGLQGAPQADFDEATLKEIAATTSGVYFNAETMQGLKEVYAEIDRLEASNDKPLQHQINDELTHYFLEAGILTALLLLLCSRSIFARFP